MKAEEQRYLPTTRITRGSRTIPDPIPVGSGSGNVFVASRDADVVTEGRSEDDSRSPAEVMICATSSKVRRRRRGYGGSGVINVSDEVYERTAEPNSSKKLMRAERGPSQAMHRRVIRGANSSMANKVIRDVASVVKIPGVTKPTEMMEISLSRQASTFI